MGVPSVCSPRREFRELVEHGVDGFLAETDSEWLDALRALAGDAALRARIGVASSTRILARYAPEDDHNDTGAADSSDGMRACSRAKLRILVVNIFFAPHSFGGATIVAEEMAHRLNARARHGGICFHLMSPSKCSTLHDPSLSATGASTSSASPYLAARTTSSPLMTRRWDAYLLMCSEAISPDIVHFHSIQHFGAAVARACQLASIPYVVTLHDAWWLCQRQFMVRADNTYCYQTTIDLKVCERCLPGVHHLQSRMDILMQALDRAALLLSPSASHAALYRANGIAHDHIRVNRNGIRRPRDAAPSPRCRVHSASAMSAATKSSKAWR